MLTGTRCSNLVVLGGGGGRAQRAGRQGLGLAQGPIISYWPSDPGPGLTLGAVVSWPAVAMLLYLGAQLSMKEGWAGRSLQGLGLHGGQHGAVLDQAWPIMEERHSSAFREMVCFRDLAWGTRWKVGSVEPLIYSRESECELGPCTLST